MQRSSRINVIQIDLARLFGRSVLGRARKLEVQLLQSLVHDLARVLRVITAEICQILELRQLLVTNRLQHRIITRVVLLRHMHVTEVQHLAEVLLEQVEVEVVVCAARSRVELRPLIGRHHSSPAKESHLLF